jgi:hypothetical protein
MSAPCWMAVRGFWKAYIKVQKHQLFHHNNGGGVVHAESEVTAEESHSEAGHSRLQAERSEREDLSALKSLWA